MHPEREQDERLLRHALALAARGVGQVSPSPLVGCVLAQDGEVVGTGYYLYERTLHAETLALAAAGPRAQGATAYVSLEPHAHQGRTPPCTAALIAAGVRRVVAPIEDPNPLVAGRGFAALRAAGIEVNTGLLAAEATRLNEHYIHAMRHARPFVHLKLACSLDGRIATRTGDARWLTGASARARVHQLRHAYDAILIGAGTALADDPLLTDRSELPRRRPLVRVVLDDRLQLAPHAQLAQTAHAAPVLVFTTQPADPAAVAALKACGVEVVPLARGARDLAAVLAELYRRTLYSVLVEGGAAVAGSFHDAGLLDKASFFIAPLIVGGTNAPPAVGGAGAQTIATATRLRDVTVTRHDADVELTGYPVARAADA